MVVIGIAEPIAAVAIVRRRGKRPPTVVGDLILAVTDGTLVGILVAAALTLALTWVALVAALAITRPDGATLADAVSLLPDVLRLVRRLAGDPSLPRATRVTLWLLLAYLASPIDLVPDFVPVLGYPDDAIIAAVALRRVVRIAGSEAIDYHWTGSAAGRAVVRRLAGLDPDR